MKLTKQQRHKAYKRALVNYNHKVWSVLCPCIGTATKVHMSNYEVCENFPEFVRFRTPNNSLGDMWWPRGDRESRVACLNACIKLTKPWWKFW